MIPPEPGGKTSHCLGKNDGEKLMGKTYGVRSFSWDLEGNPRGLGFHGILTENPGDFEGFPIWK